MYILVYTSIYFYNLYIPVYTCIYTLIHKTHCIYKYIISNVGGYYVRLKHLSFIIHIMSLLCHIMSLLCQLKHLQFFDYYVILCHVSEINYYINYVTTIMSIIFLSLLLLLCQLKLDYITYFKSDLLYQLFISPVIIPIIFFDAIKTINLIKHINSLISFPIYYIYYVFWYILILLYYSCILYQLNWLCHTNWNY